TTKRNHRNTRRFLGAVPLLALCVSGCAVGPRYQKPSAPAPASYKELTPDNAKDVAIWKEAQPKDSTLKGKWWELYNDPQLDSLGERAKVWNQSFAAASASFLAARALVKEVRSQLFPTVSLAGPNITETHGSQSGPGSTSSTQVTSSTGLSRPSG